VLYTAIVRNMRPHHRFQKTRPRLVQCRPSSIVPLACLSYPAANFAFNRATPARHTVTAMRTPDEPMPKILAILNRPRPEPAMAATRQRTAPADDLPRQILTDEQRRALYGNGRYDQAPHAKLSKAMKASGPGISEGQSLKHPTTRP
jgi:hypothetical protein